MNHSARIGEGARSGVRRILVRAPWRNLTVRAAAGTAGANMAILIINILTGVVTARVLAPVGRGELAAITMWPQFLGFALAFGLPTSLVYHLQRDEHDRSDLLTAALLLATAGGLVGTAIGVVAIPLSLRAYHPDAVRVAQWAMLFTPFGVALNVLFAAFLREGTFATYNLARLAQPCTTLVVLVALALARLLNPATAALAYLAPTLPIAAYTFLSVQRRMGFSRRVDRPTSRSLLRYGLAYYGSELIGAVSSQLDRILVVWLLAPSAMGLYVVALSFSRLFQQLPISISTAILPKMSSATPDEVVRLTVRAVAVSGGLSTLAALPAALLAPFILTLFFGPQFGAASNAFIILTAEALIGGLAIILSQAFLGLGRPVQTSIYSLVGMLTIIPLLLLLGYRYGLVGTALATVGSSVVRVSFMAIGLRRLHRQIKRSAGA